MTWDEFKRAIDQQLEEKGIDGDIEIWYIDVAYPNDDEIDVGIDHGLGLSIF